MEEMQIWQLLATQIIGFSIFFNILLTLSNDVRKAGPRQVGEFLNNSNVEFG